MLEKYKTLIRKNPIVSAVVLLLVLFVIVMWIRGPEDDWICVDGEWVEHGYPSAPKPVGSCEARSWLKR